MSNCYGKDCHGTAIDHLVAAMGHARQGNDQKADEHIKKARNFATANASMLRAQGQHDEAKRYMQGFDFHEGVVRNLSAEKNTTKKAEKKGDIAKSEPKKDASPRQSPSAGQSQVKGNPSQKIGHVQESSEFNYKMIGELHPEDQMRAQRFFNNKDVGRFKYPVDKMSGRIVHGQRVPMGDKDGPTDPSKTSYPEIPSHLRDGAAVRFHLPGTALHGRLGVVGSMSPFHPDKVSVQYGHKNTDRVYVHPSSLKSSKPSTKIEKALVTLTNIRKAFLK